MYGWFSISYFWIQRIWDCWIVFLTFFHLHDHERRNIIQYLSRITESCAFKTTMTLILTAVFLCFHFLSVAIFPLWRYEQTHRPCVYSGMYVVCCSIGSSTVVSAMFEAFGDFIYFPGADQPSSSDNISLHSDGQDAEDENIRSLPAAGKLWG